jgi:ketosteroid isomerase-like protein
MRRMIIGVLGLAVAAAGISCGETGPSNNAANRPANNAANTNTTAAANPAAVEAEIKKLMGDLASALAKNDADAAAKFYSDDYHLVTAEGVDQDRAARIADMRSGATKFNSFAYEDIKVRSYGDTAVAITTVKLSGNVGGRPQSGDIIATLVFRKMADGWKVVSGHATRVAAATPAKSDEKVPAGNSNAAANASANK